MIFFRLTVSMNLEYLLLALEMVKHYKSTKNVELENYIKSPPPARNFPCTVGHAEESDVKCLWKLIKDDYKGKMGIFRYCLLARKIPSKISYALGEKILG